jgi:hypothetical protein
VTFTAADFGTAGILTCRINGGIDKASKQPDPIGTMATAKFFVPLDGYEVGAAGENYESDPVFGSTGIINSAIRGVAAGGAGGISTLTGIAPIGVTSGVNPDVSISPATELVPGSMSAADKQKLDGMGAGAAIVAVSVSAPLVSSGGSSPSLSLPDATDSAAGALSATDKTKLDGLIVETVWSAQLTAAQVVACGAVSNALLYMNPTAFSPTTPGGLVGYAWFVAADAYWESTDASFVMSSGSPLLMDIGTYEWGYIQAQNMNLSQGGPGSYPTRLPGANENSHVVGPVTINLHVATGTLDQCTAGSCTVSMIFKTRSV